MEVKAEYRTMFAEEARERVEEWEQTLLRLEHNPTERDLVHGMFRAIHTLKGSAGFIGFEKLQRVTHRLESALQDARDRDAGLTPEMLQLLFQGLDLARKMVESFRSGQEFEEDVEGFLSLLPIGDEQPLAAPSATHGPGAPSGRRRFELKLVLAPSGREAFVRAFLVRKRLEDIAHIVLEDPAPETLMGCPGSQTWVLILDTDRDEADLRRALNVDQLEILSVREMPQGGPSAEGSLGSSEPPPTVHQSFKAEEVVRVSVERLDALLNLVGELVIQNSGFLTVGEVLRGQYGRTAAITDLEEKVEALGKVTRDLQDGIMKVRMLPVVNVFNRFHRVVRDLARAHGKEIRLEFFGEETEIDKKVMDRIAEPLLHLVRNAADHGIEGREERLASGKSGAGRIRLGACQEGDHICVEVSDDGRGLDRDAILRKAVEKGLIQPQEKARVSDERLLGLIFLPGFSTAKEVTEISGRGVGMDAVRKAVQEMGGSIRVRSATGQGTAVTISLPLTMAILPALLVEAADSTLAVPVSSVKEVVKVKATELQTVGTRPVIRLRDEVLALVELAEALGLGRSGHAKDPQQKIPVVVVDFEGKRLGLAVNRIARTREVVIKSLSRHYEEISGLIGASILGNGAIALIVDVEALVRQHHHATAEHEISSSAVVTVQGFADRSEGGAPALEEAQPQSSAAELMQELSGPNGPLLEEIHNAGAIQASIAVSQLTGRAVEVTFPEFQLVPLAEVADSLGGEETPVAGIYVGLAGELEGGMVILIPQGNLPPMHDLLHQRAVGTCASLDEVDLSAISELGNILSASFINAMSDGTKLSIRHDPPEIGMDMRLSVIDSVVARFVQPGDYLLLTKAYLSSGDVDQLACCVALFLEPGSLRKLMNALAGSQDDA